MKAITKIWIGLGILSIISVIRTTLGTLPEEYGCMLLLSAFAIFQIDILRIDEVK